MYEYKFAAPSERYVPDLEGNSETHPDGIVKPGDRVVSTVRLNSPHFEKAEGKKAEPKKREAVTAKEAK